MRVLKYVLALTLISAPIAGFFYFDIAERYVLRAQTATNHVWPLKPRHATVIFGGDMLFDRSIRLVADAKGGDFIFSCVDAVLGGADLVVANLEGPITEHASVSASSAPGDAFNYTFTFPPATAELLYEHNIRMVNLGNNHILNFGREGARSTTRYLQDAGVAHFGLPAGASAQAGEPMESTVAAGTINRIPFSFINYNEFSGGGAASTTVVQIRRARGAGHIPVVYTHWGIEYATTSSAYSRELAHSFVDAGAEIVIGSHPHVVEESETYRGKRIYYSLGNFIFDQYMNDDVQHGLLLEVTFGPSGVQVVKEIPIELQEDRRTCPVE